MKQVLLYNFSKQKGLRVEAVCAGLQIGVRHVRPDEYTEQIGAIAGFPGFAKKGMPPCNTPFEDEMLLFSQLMPREIHAALDAFRTAGIVVGLKASLTRHNIHWNSLQLHKELAAEQQALR